jgi:hypothetical protein
LIKLAEIPQVVDVVSVAFRTGSFAARWQPNIVYANSLQGVDLTQKSFPMLSISRDVPLKALKQSTIFGGGLLI